MTVRADASARVSRWLTDGQGGFHAALRQSAAAHPDRDAVRWRDRRVDYAELERRAGLVARALVAAGAGEGDRVALLMKNRVELVELLFGCARIGAIAVVLNWRLSGDELAVVIDDADCRALITDPAIRPTSAYAGELTTSPLVIELDDAAEGATRYEDWLSATESDPEPEHAADPSTAVLLYTSGTTGRPKGVMLGHYGLWSLLSKGYEDWHMDDESVLLCPLPAFHIGGLGWIIGSVACGSTLILQEDADPQRIIDVIESDGVTNALLVPTLMTSMVEVQNARHADLSSLRTIVYGGSPMTAVRLRAALDVLDADLIQAYGLTEMTSSVTQFSPEDHRRAAHQGEVRAGETDLLRTCGRPRRGVEITIHDPDDGHVLPAGQVGEVWINAEQRMQGYWRRPAETAEVLLPDGTLRTGDLGYFDANGYLYLVDRLKDMIVSGGENVYPGEVENVLVDHPAVADVAVVGVPHEKWVETPKAFVVLRPGATATPDELIAYTRDRIAHYKCPTQVEFLDQLPRNPAGKVLRRTLRARHSG